MKITQATKNKDLRPNTVSITLSDRELAVIDEYCALFKAKSRASVIRTGAVHFALEKLIDKKSELFDFDALTSDEKPQHDAPSATEDNQPSLFDEETLRNMLK